MNSLPGPPLGPWASLDWACLLYLSCVSKLKFPALPWLSRACAYSSNTVLSRLKIRSSVLEAPTSSAQWLCPNRKCFYFWSTRSGILCPSLFVHRMSSLIVVRTHARLILFSSGGQSSLSYSLSFGIVVCSSEPRRLLFEPLAACGADAELSWLKKPLFCLSSGSTPQGSFLGQTAFEGSCRWSFCRTYRTASPVSGRKEIHLSLDFRWTDPMWWFFTLAFPEASLRFPKSGSASIYSGIDSFTTFIIESHQIVKMVFDDP